MTTQMDLSAIRLFPGVSPFISRALPLVCAGVVAAWSAWLLYSDCNRYLRAVPPRDQLCGLWSIDRKRTTWHAAKDFLSGGGLDPRSGLLELKADGKFSVKAIPDFSRSTTTFTLWKSGSGNWWTSVNSQGFSYLWLGFEEIDARRAVNMGSSRGVPGTRGSSRDTVPNY